MKILITAIFFLTTLFFVSCEKEYSYEDGGATQADGTWQFFNGSIEYNGNIDSASIQDVTGTKVLLLTGKSLDGKANFSLRLFSTDSFTTRTYLASLSEIEFDYFTTAKTIYTGDFLAGEFSVTITSISKDIITGIFSGSVTDSTGVPTKIQSGTFTSQIDLSNNGGGQGGTQSTGTLGANPDTCSPLNILGTYTKGIALSSSNTVQVQVSVTIPGSYIIATNSVNGVNFFKAGTFTSPGVQTVILNGSGTPTNEGIQYYTVTYGASNCTFPVTFLPGSAPIADYLPTTLGSNWAYALEGGTPSDSISAKVISYAPTIAGNVYTSFETDEIPSSGSSDTTYYRKSGNDYFTYHNVSPLFQFDNPVLGEYIFLNDALPEGSSFRSPNYNGTFGGAPVTGYIQVTILEKAVPATIGAFSFDDVIKVQYEYFYTAIPGVPALIEERWFARGVGLIYDDLSIFAYRVGRYTVL